MGKSKIFLLISILLTIAGNGLGQQGQPCASDADCEDGLPCTVNVCDATGHCAFTVVSHPCPFCHANADCDDGNPCTYDYCDRSGECHSYDCDCAVDDDTYTGNCFLKDGLTYCAKRLPSGQVHYVFPNDFVLSSCIIWFEDSDGDGYGNEGGSHPISGGETPHGYVLNNDDCNDARPDIHEICPTLYFDLDGDGYGDATTAFTPYYGGTRVTYAPYVENGDDCNDTDPTIHEGCILYTWYLDNDGDGFGNMNDIGMSAAVQPAGRTLDHTDCNDDLLDGGETIYPGAPGGIRAVVVGSSDICPGTIAIAIINHNCSSTFDETTLRAVRDDGLEVDDLHIQDPDGNFFLAAFENAPPGSYVISGCNDIGECFTEAAYVTCTWYIDNDGDTFGDINDPGVQSETQPQDRVSSNTDCNDDDSEANTNTIWYLDADGDGWFSETERSCERPVMPNGWIQGNICCGWFKYFTKGDNDCDDTPPGEILDNGLAINPGATEKCNDNIDNNCDDRNNEGCDVDADGDTWTVGEGDCDDTDPKINPDPNTEEDCSTDDDDNCDRLYFKNNCNTAKLTLIVTHTYYNVGQGCPNGTDFDATFALDNCYTDWELYSPDLQGMSSIPGQDGSWQGAKGQVIHGTLPAINKSFSLIAVAGIAQNPHGCGDTVNLVVNNPAFCNGEVEMVGVKPATGFATTDASATFDLTASSCLDDVPWTLTLTKVSNGAQYSGAAVSIDDNITIPMANGPGLPGGTYDVSFSYGGFCNSLTGDPVFISKGGSITTANVSGQLQDITKGLCPLTTIEVAYTSADVVFGDTNVFKVQLSDPYGSFANPTTLLGNYINSALSTGIVEAYIPQLQPEGTGYKVRVISTGPILFGSESVGSFTILNSTDADNDGFSVCEGDCNDGVAAIRPRAPEICNGINDDCDSLDGTELIDEGFVYASPPGQITCVDIFPESPDCNVFACKNSTHLYQVAAQPGRTFTWTAPEGATIFTPVGQLLQTWQSVSNNVVTVRYSNEFVSGKLSVIVSGNCGTTPPVSEMSITSLQPPPPTSILGLPIVCKNDAKIYSCTPVAGVTEYDWVVEGADIISIAGTTAAIQFHEKRARIKVRVTGCDSNAPFQTRKIAVRNCQ